MIKKLITCISSILLLLNCWGQDSETGFNNQPGTDSKGSFNKVLFYTIADSIRSIHPSAFLLGARSSFREHVSDIDLKITVNGNPSSISRIDKGYFIIHDLKIGSQVNISTTHREYYDSDTLITIKNMEDYTSIITLNPKFKITLRGRVYSGNIPVEDVDVKIIHGTDSFNLKTLSCYYDNEDYWNCLYHGMFKYDIATENTTDSIYIFLSKNGYKNTTYAVKFDEYSGDIIPLKIRYDGLLPKLYHNNIALKLTFPLISEKNWFAGFSYLYSLKLHKFNRLALGAEGSILIKNQVEEFPTLNGLDNAKADTSYLIGFAGPTAVVWITNPLIRNYSVYLGSTYAYMFNSETFSFQPFIGGRFFVDLNKAISFDLRYLSYELDVVKYTFNPYGAAIRTIERESLKNQIMISVGLHIGF